MVAAIDFDIGDIDNAGGYDRLQGLPVGLFDVEIATLEAFKTGVDEDGDVIPGKKEGKAVSVKVDVLKVINQKATCPDDPGYEKELASEYPPPGLVKEGERRSWFCNVEHEQNRKRLRHLVQAALGFEPDGPAATSAKDEEGNPVSWKQEVVDAMKEDNALASCKLRVRISRVVTQKGKGFAMYVPDFSLIPE